MGGTSPSGYRTSRSVAKFVLNEKRGLVVYFALSPISYGRIVEKMNTDNSGYIEMGYQEYWL